MMRLIFFAVFVVGAQGRIFCPYGEWWPPDNKCYVMLRHSLNWFNALTACQVVNGSLVEITHYFENQYVEGILINQNVDKVWIGVNDLLKQRDFKMATTKYDAGYTSWGKGEPDDSRGEKDCVTLDKHGKWDDENCDTRYYCICEIMGRFHVFG